MFDEKKGVSKFVFKEGEPRRCSSCGKTLGGVGWVCRDCLSVFCYDCVRAGRTCNCHKYSFEHMLFRSELEGGVV